jgi:methyl-accepting chemotaxis protein
LPWSWNEIKTLATEAGNATQEIEALIETVQQSTSAAVADMREMGDGVDDGMVTVQEAIDALGDIVSRVDDVNAGIQEISDAADKQSQSTPEVVTMSEIVAAVSEQVSNEAVSVSEASQEQTETLTAVTDNVVALSDQATDLQRELDGFTVSQSQTQATIADD